MAKRYFRFLWLWLAAAALLLASTPATMAATAEKSQTVIIGTLGTGTINYAAAVALSDVLNKHSNLKASVLPQTGVPALLSLLKDGAVHLITVSAPEAQMVNTGGLSYKGRGQPLVLLHPVYSVEQALLAAGDSKIRTPSEVRGKRVVGRYSGDPGTELGILGQLANRGMSYNDVVVVPVTSYAEGMRAVIERKADVAASGLTSPLVQQLRAARGFQIIPADPSPEGVKRTQAVAPGYNIISLPKSDPSLGWLRGDADIPDKLTLLQYWFYFAASPELGDSAAYEVNKTVWEHYKELGPVQIKFPRDWNPEHMISSTVVIPYHPGAIRWFKEKGVWTSAMDPVQKRLLAESVKR